MGRIVSKNSPQNYPVNPHETISSKKTDSRFARISGTDIKSTYLINTDNHTITALKITILDKTKLESVNINDLALLEENEGKITFKASRETTSKLIEKGSKLQVQTEEGVRTYEYKSVNYQEMTDKELNNVIYSIKILIAFLRATSDPEDDEANEKIEVLEVKLKYLEIEKAARIDDKETLKLLLEDTLNFSCARVAEEVLDAKALEKRRLEEKERKLEDLKVTILKDEILKYEVCRDTLKKSTLSQEINSNTVEASNSINGKTRVLVNLSRYIKIVESSDEKDKIK